MNLTTKQLRNIISEELGNFLTETQLDADTLEMLDGVEELGFSNVEFISSGQYGSVFKGNWDHAGDSPRAIKVLKSGVLGRKEAYIYRMISDARGKFPLIAKHFPRVDMTRKSPNGKFIFIVMELLEDDPNVKQVIEDIFGFAEVDIFRPDLALDVDLGISKDIGKRSNMLVIDKPSRIEVLNRILYGFPAWISGVKQRLVAMNINTKTKFPYDGWRETTRKIPAGHDFKNTITVIEDDFERSGVIAMTFFAYVVIFIIKEWDKDPNAQANGGYPAIFDMLQYAAEDFIQMYRSWTPVGMSPVGTNPSYHGAPESTKGLNYPGAQSLLAAIEKVKDELGIDAYDMHDRNVLVRPGTKDLVIVDVGMFREDNPKPKPYSKMVTNIQEKK